MNIYHPHLKHIHHWIIGKRSMLHVILIATVTLAAVLVIWQKPFNLSGLFSANSGEERFSPNLAELPLRFPDSLVPPLQKQLDATLQLKLEGLVLQNPKWSALVKQKQMSVGLVDLRNPFQPRFARLNGDKMMYAASLPKIAVLLACMDAIEKGTLKITPEIRQDMRLMIAKSDNAATTRMIDRVGLIKIGEVMQDPEYGFYNAEKGGGLWVGKRYAKTGPRYGDPLMNISHGATATQVCRYYYLLAYGHLINYQRSKEMLGYLVDPELHHKFVNTLDRVAPNAKVFRKSGTWRDYHADSALIWGPDGRRYILVALVQDANGEQIMRQLIKVVDEKLISRSAS